VRGLNGKQLAALIGRSPQWVYDRRIDELPHHMPRRKHQRYEFTDYGVSDWLDAWDGGWLRDHRFDAVKILTQQPSMEPMPDDVLGNRQLVALMLDSLDERLSLALTVRYGIGCKALTLEDVGELLDVSRERARQIIIKAQREALKWLVRKGHDPRVCK
jgi:hypothetical protein